MKKTVVVSAFHLIYISVLAKLLSFLVRTLLARKLGSEAMSCYSIVAPTMVFLISLVQQGIPAALSKLSAQSSDPKLPLAAGACISALTIALTLSLFTCILPFFAGELLHDIRLIPVLRALLPLLPAVALSGLLKGYLQGIQHHYAANITQLYEEAARIVFLVVCFALFPTQDPIALASLAMFSVTVGELASCICMLCHLRFSFHHIRIAPRVLSRVRPDQLRDILSISMPMMGSRLSGSLTYFLEPICMLLLVPASMSAQIVEGYGILNGYTLPLLTMPSFLSITLSNYLLPSFSYAIAPSEKAGKKAACSSDCCLLFGILYALFCYCFSEPLFQLFYHTSQGADRCMHWPCPSCSTACSPAQCPAARLFLSAQAFCDTLIGSCSAWDVSVF
ncbi:MAG: oligosaccharide flippase family protein [Merdibacter sp.]